MASRALHPIETESIENAIWPAAAYRGLIAEASQSQATVFPAPAVDLTISRVVALQGAKGALMALGIEAAAGLCLFGIWQIWLLLR